MACGLKRNGTPAIRLFAATGVIADVGKCDGGIWPYDPAGGRMRPLAVNIFVAPPGSGKSVLANTINLSLVPEPGQAGSETGLAADAAGKQPAPFAGPGHSLPSRWRELGWRVT